MSANNLKIYNSLSGDKEVFKPIKSGYVGMYVCGPTVYSEVHLGNVRTFLSFDLVYRYLRFLGYKVRYVRNITDVGHLLEDEEDKISKKARLEQIEPMEVVQRYTVNFREVLREFNFLPPDIEPTATGHIMEQIEITQDLLNKGLAYEVNGSVYFDVRKYDEEAEYGILSRRNLEDLLANSRELDAQDEKHFAADFALWKKAHPEHIMRWNSPWGEGFPGWHLECTAMSTKYLGEVFDIHGGGMDLKFPHHECEIAQAKAFYGTYPVKYWMHTNMLTLNGQKMSKSTGNTILPMELISGDNDFFDKGFNPNILRFFMLQAHYRSTLDFSNEALLASEKGYLRLMEGWKILEMLSPNGEQSEWDAKAWEQSLYDVMNDDFNSPMLIAQLFEGVKMVHQIKDERIKVNAEDLGILKKNFNTFIQEVLGIENAKTEQSGTHLDKVMQVLIEMRNQARTDKNFQLSDEIRDQLQTAGISLLDGKEGTTYKIEA